MGAIIEWIAENWEAAALVFSALAVMTFVKRKILKPVKAWLKENRPESRWIDRIKIAKHILGAAISVLEWVVTYLPANDNDIDYDVGVFDD